MRQIVATPAGPLDLVCLVDDEAATLGYPESGRAGLEQRSVANSAEVTCIQVEMQPPPYGSGPPVDVLLGVVWKVTAYASCGPLEFDAHLTDADAIQYMSPSNGEWLESVTFQRPDLLLSIGTHDNEALKSRTDTTSGTRAGLSLPASWASVLAVDRDGEYGARADNRGIAVRLPSLSAGDTVQIHFAIAWAYDRDDDSTWYAVDTNSIDILHESPGL